MSKIDHARLLRGFHALCTDLRACVVAERVDGGGRSARALRSVASIGTALGMGLPHRAPLAVGPAPTPGSPLPQGLLLWIKRPWPAPRSLRKRLIPASVAALSLVLYGEPRSPLGGAGSNTTTRAAPEPSNSPSALSASRKRSRTVSGEETATAGSLDGAAASHGRLLDDAASVGTAREVSSAVNVLVPRHKKPRSLLQAQ